VISHLVRANLTTVYRGNSGLQLSQRVGPENVPANSFTQFTIDRIVALA